jgi:hypothetical protein
MDPRVGACLACLTAAQDAAALEPRRLAAQMQEEVRRCTLARAPSLPRHARAPCCAGAERGALLRCETVRCAAEAHRVCTAARARVAASPSV